MRALFIVLVLVGLFVGVPVIANWTGRLYFPNVQHQKINIVMSKTPIPTKTFWYPPTRTLGPIVINTFTPIATRTFTATPIP